MLLMTANFDDSTDVDEDDDDDEEVTAILAMIDDLFLVIYSTNWDGVSDRFVLFRIVAKQV